MHKYSSRRWVLYLKLLYNLLASRHSPLILQTFHSKFLGRILAHHLQISQHCLCLDYLWRELQFCHLPFSPYNSLQNRKMQIPEIPFRHLSFHKMCKICHKSCLSSSAIDCSPRNKPLFPHSQYHILIRLGFHCPSPLLHLQLSLNSGTTDIQILRIYQEGAKWNSGLLFTVLPHEASNY